MVLEGVAGDAFDDVTDQGVAVLGAGGDGPGFVDLLGRVGRQAGSQVDLAVVEQGPAPVPLLVTAGVGQQVAQGDLGVEGARRREVEIFGDVGVQVQFAGLDEEHRRGGGHRFGQLAHVEEVLLRVHRCGDDVSGGGLVVFVAGARLGVAVAARGEDLAVRDHAHGGAGDPLGLQGGGQGSVEPGLDVVPGGFFGPGRVGHRGRGRGGGHVRGASHGQQGRRGDGQDRSAYPASGPESDPARSRRAGVSGVGGGGGVH